MTLRVLASHKPLVLGFAAALPLACVWVPTQCRHSGKWWFSLLVAERTPGGAQSLLLRPAELAARRPPPALPELLLLPCVGRKTALLGMSPGKLVLGCHVHMSPRIVLNTRGLFYSFVCRSAGLRSRRAASLRALAAEPLCFTAAVCGPAGTLHSNVLLCGKDMHYASPRVVIAGFTLPCCSKNMP